MPGIVGLSVCRGDGGGQCAVPVRPARATSAQERLAAEGAISDSASGMGKDP
jgi:hypothetical protein